MAQSGDANIEPGLATFSLYAFLERTATQGERSVARIRLIIAATVTLQFLFLRRGLEGLMAGSLKHWLILAGIGVLCAFSVGVLTLLKEHHVGRGIRIGSIAVDVIAATLILIPSSIFPKESYVGFLTRPDPAIFLIVAMCAGFRLSTAGMWLATALTTLGVGLILTVDFTLNSARLAYKVDSVVVFALLTAACVVIGFSVKNKIVSLVRDAATAIIAGERARQRFGVYLSQELVDEALSADVLRPGGQRQSVAVLFSDLRGFTTYSENLPPEQLVEELNAYLEAMVSVIKAEGGVIDKYIGDAIMVVFGIPSGRGDDAARALRTALRMEQALAEHNEQRVQGGLPALRHGVGVHYGEVVAGNLGTSERLQYTVVGDTVNLASRLESATKELGVTIVLSAELIEAVPEDERAAAVRSCGSITVKGRGAPVEVFTFEG